MNRLKESLKLFLIFFRIGLFTFGGGYAMIPLILNEIVEKRKYISSEEFSDIVAIAESTPGPIAINSATYIGYRRAGVLGAIFATLGVSLPSLIIIYLISLFFREVLEYPLVNKAFAGIQCAVSVLIISAGVKLIKNVSKNVFSYILLALSLLALLAIDFFDLDISTIYFIIVGAVVGIIYFYPRMKKSDNGLIWQHSAKIAKKDENKDSSDCTASASEDTSAEDKTEGDKAGAIGKAQTDEAAFGSATVIKDNAVRPKNKNKGVIVALCVTIFLSLVLFFFGGVYGLLFGAVDDTSPYAAFFMVCKLYSVFFRIGLFSFGGGYGMIPLMMQETIGTGWVTEAEFSSFIAVAESTPGPISINMATYIGSTQCGIVGSVFSTLGVIVPSFLVILSIVALLKNFLENKVVRAALTGMKPVICGLILATGIWMALTNVLSEISDFSLSSFSLAALIITALCGIACVCYKLWRKKNLSPILLILFSAAMGMLMM